MQGRGVAIGVAICVENSPMTGRLLGHTLLSEMEH